MPTLPPRKLRKTLGDYFAIGLAPALVVVLVGSLVFFLVEVLYHGAHGGRLRWTLAWFTVASVLVTRIAIELGSSRGFLHGFALAGVTTLALIRYIEPPFAGILLLAIAWFCVDRLVRDCTLIDDDADATGEGLLDGAGLGDAPRGGSRDGERPRGRLLYRQHATREALRTHSADVLESAPDPAPPGRPPGFWVVGFSLAALPLFGLGQAALPVADTNRREIAFTCLWFYLLAAFGLLLTTSFLGLRRYLRQRRIQMPASIAASWLGRGTVLAVTMLLVAFLLPRPQATHSLPALAERLGSQLSARPNATGAGKPAPGREGNSGKPGDGSSTGEARSGSTAGQGASASGSSGTKDTPGSGAPSPSQAQGSAAGSPESATPRSANVPEVTALGRLLKWILYGLFGVAMVVLWVRYGGSLWAALVELWKDLWSWAGRRPRPTEGAPSTPAAPRPRPFSSYRNPFTDPRMSRMSPADLVTYSFEALQAWSSGYGISREANETPMEFSRRLAESAPDLADPIRVTLAAYSGNAYAGRIPSPEVLNSVRQLWALMTPASGRDPGLSVHRGQP